MRQDQKDRLLELSEKVGEVFLDEADPGNWSGNGKRLSEMDEKERGGRYFDKKNAIQCGTLWARILDLHDRDMGYAKGSETPADDADKEIKRFENQAKDLIKKVQDAAGTKR